MRRLDNRGFAFSTILYGLMLLGIMVIFVIMSTMQTNRQTNKEFVSKIEEELNRFSLTETTINNSSGSSSDSQEYIVPIGQSGWYKIELWGAGGGYNGSGVGGYGSYTSGLIWLEENRHLYFYIGNQGKCGTARNGSTATFNGGGLSSGGDYSCNGGGATDVRLRDGAWNENLEYRIMVAAGGGGASNNGTNYKGGAGGGFYGYRGRSNSSYTSAFTYSLFGNGQNAPSGNTGGGGGGYYGGITADGLSGSGGSSYIAGYAGSRSYGRSTTDGADYAINLKALEESAAAAAAKTAGTYDVGDLNAYFLNGFMLAGVNNSNGSAKIQKISDGDRNNPPAIYNSDFDKTFNKVKECYTTMTNNSNVLSEIQVLYRGKNLIYNAGDEKRNGNTGDAPSFSTACVEYAINPPSKVDEVAVWHYGLGASGDGTSRYVREHELTLTATDGSVVYLSHKGGNYMRDFDETSVGMHYSAWNPKVGDSISDGIYYIQSATGDNLFLTKRGTDVKLTTFTGDNNQKWSITALGSGYYKISSLLDLDNTTTLQIKDGAEYDGSAIGISEFVGSRVGGFEWEKWKLSDANNGTFYITSGFNTRLSTTATTYTPIGTVSTKSLTSKTPNNSTTTTNSGQRFRILNASY